MKQKFFFFNGMEENFRKLQLPLIQGEEENINVKRSSGNTTTTTN